ncbi:hypothetical protein [Flavobacterium sp. N3904]|uniref:hypothetical protein n=1 Tax=Flavobacterium sp. N3904 TaxID=2986835 RepID=UPI0022251656|nr:hypothetical protein [Flavobacterium sp. N3904]
MKKQYLLIILFLFLYKSYGQEPMQESYVTKTYVNTDEGWSEVNFSAMVNISSNRKGQLKISNAEFLTELSGGKAKMLENSAYNSAEFTSQVLSKEKTEKNGVINLTFDGKLVYKCHEGSYTVPSKIIFRINQADIIGLKILNRDNNKEFAVDLEIKE